MHSDRTDFTSRVRSSRHGYYRGRTWQKVCPGFRGALQRGVWPLRFAPQRTAGRRRWRRGSEGHASEALPRLPPSRPAPSAGVLAARDPGAGSCSWPRWGSAGIPPQAGAARTPSPPPTPPSRAVSCRCCSSPRLPPGEIKVSLFSAATLAVLL